MRSLAVNSQLTPRLDLGNHIAAFGLDPWLILGLGKSALCDRPMKGSTISTCGHCSHWRRAVELMLELVRGAVPKAPVFAWRRCFPDCGNG